MSETVVASTATGRVRGQRREHTLAFRGIPYAAAPVGELRFAAPAPHPTITANGSMTQKDGAAEKPSNAAAVIAVLNAVTLAVPSLLRIPVLNMLESTVQPEMRNVRMLTASTGTPISVWAAGHAEPTSESGTPRPIKAI